MSRLAVLLVLLTLTACSWATGTQPERDAGQEERQRISGQVRGLDGVTAVEAVYQDTIVTGGILGVKVTVRPGTPAEPLLDEAERLVWTSSLDPLGTIALGVIEEGSPADDPGVQRGYVTEADFARLTQKYGPRPTS